MKYFWATRKTNSAGVVKRTLAAMSGPHSTPCSLKKLYNPSESVYRFELLR